MSCDEDVEKANDEQQQVEDDDDTKPLPDETDEMYTDAQKTPQREELDEDDDIYDEHTHVKNVSVQVEGGQRVTGHAYVVTKGQTTKGQMILMQELNDKLDMIRTETCEMECIALAKININ